MQMHQTKGLRSAHKATGFMGRHKSTVGGVKMAFIDNYDFELLQNEAEKLVITELGRQLESFSEPICTCNECVVDMAAVALNTVKPLYRVSLMGSFYTSHAMDEKEYARYLRETVFDAIEKVRKNPSHEAAEKK
jgi:competence protein ComFB